MLSLDSPQWSQLSHAYGEASDIPDLLRQLEHLPTSANNSEPWFSLWSSLAHQGDVYSASFAAVPHIIGYLSTAPGKAHWTFFQFPAWVEICRIKRGLAVPVDLAPAYWEALAKLPQLVATAATGEWDEDMLSCALAAIAASKGFATVAEAALELNTSVAVELLARRFD